MLIRAEQPNDISAIRHIHQRAFEIDVEANIVDALRQYAQLNVSLVAVDGSAEPIGHIAFSPVTLDGDSGRPRLCGLAPMAVVPSRQRQGIGGRLIEAGLRECTDLGFDAVVVLGHTEYYPRFGFVPASRFALRNEFDVPEQYFMALELRATSLRGCAGVVHYDPAFRLSE
jgi:putative acetyltransferase